MAITIKHRRDTSANWSSVNPVLAEGELGIELDTDRIKIGDGTTAWNTLDYATVTPGDVSGQVLPPGGTTGQVLSKANNDDFDVEWQDIDALPEGGTTGQVLSKASNADGDATWTDPPQGFDPSTMNPVVIGEHATSDGMSATALGTWSEAAADSATAVGGGAFAEESYSTALGAGSWAQDQYTTAVGYGASSDTTNPLVISYGYGSGRRLIYSTDEEALWSTTDFSEMTGTGTRRYHPHSEEIIRIKALTQAEYDALATKDPATLYVVTG